MVLIALPLSLCAGSRHLFERDTHATLLFEHLVEATRERGDVGHSCTVSSTDLASSTVVQRLVGSGSRCDTEQDLPECTRIDLHLLLPSSVGKLEERAVQPLVEDAVAVAIEPQHLQAVRAPVGEHEHRSALRILAE